MGGLCVCVRTWDSFVDEDAVGDALGECPRFADVISEAIHCFGCMRWTVVNADIG